MLQAYQWPLLGSPEPGAAAQAVVAANAGPAPAVPAAAPVAPVLATSSGMFAIGGPFDPDPHHALLGAGGPSDPDPAHRQARQADEQRFLEQTGAPWDRAVYVTATPG
jgi:hypothetical protein